MEIECSDSNLSPKDVAAEALTLWQATEGAKTSEGPAYGFTPQANVGTNHSTYGRASFHHGERPVVE